MFFARSKYHALRVLKKLMSFGRSVGALLYIIRRALVATLFICCASLANPGDLGIVTLSQQNKTLFLVQVGVFEHQKEADAYLKQLSTQVKQPISIQRRQSSGLYVVQIGPVDDYRVAVELEKKWTMPMGPAASKAPAKTWDQEDDVALTNTDKPVTTGNSDTKIWNLRNADIRAVIGEVSRITKKNFVIDPRVSGKISIVSSTPISDRELYAVFLSMLQVSGYAAIPNGDIIKILPNMDARTTSGSSFSQRRPPSADDMMVQVIPVQYVPAEQLVPVLRPLMPQWSSVSAYAPSNALILSGRASNIQQLADIISQVDNSSASGIDIVPLKHALAMDVANTLKDLVLSQMNQHKNNQTMIAADDRGNAILISGNKTDRIRIRLLILQLDQQNTASTNNNTQVIYLHYLRAEDLVPILAGIAQASFSGTVGTTIGTVTLPVLDSTNPTSNMGNLNPSDVSNNQAPIPQTAPAQTTPAPGANTQTEGSSKPNIQIIAEPNTNSVIINGPAKLIQTLRTVIQQLDIKPAQLLIEALIAELDESDFKNLGLEWGSVDQTTHKSDTFRPGFAVLNSHTSISQFEARIYALAREKRANILSTPSVVVLDNRQAKILIGKQVSVATSSYPNNASGTTVASPYTNFDRVNVALHLYVRPQITNGTGIQLQIDQGNNTLASPIDELNPNTFPVFNISAIVTSVHVHSGDIVVLGGLAQDSVTNDDNNLPILSEIPGIGRLFQRNLTQREKKVLMVFIRPHILRNEHDVLEFTGRKYNHVRHDQLDIARFQEEYNKKDKNTIAPPWHQSRLPKPFCKKSKLASAQMKD